MSSLVLSDELLERRTAGRTLRWECDPHHAVAGALHAKIVGLASARLSIEVWVMGKYPEDLEEMAYCRGIVSIRERRLKVLWLGGRGERAVHQNVKGLRCVSLPGYKEAEHAPSSGCGDARIGRVKRTLAEAIFGLVAAIAGGCFEVTEIELQAMDNGSGKLVNMYRNLGLRLSLQQQSDLLWMDGPLDLISVLAPEVWYSSLVPDGFNGQDWMLEHLFHMKDEMRLIDRLRQHWRIPLDWPEGGCHLAARLFLYDGEATHRSGFHKFALDVIVADSSKSSFLELRANIWPDRKLVHVLYLGQQRHKPVHPVVKGKRRFDVTKPSSTGETRVTAAVGVLGVCAAVGSWLGAETLEMRVSDHGSGKIVPYFNGHGFQTGAPLPQDGAPVKLDGPCGLLAERCCPISWRAELPPAGDVLSMFDDKLPRTEVLEQVLGPRVASANPVRTVGDSLAPRHAEVLAGTAANEPARGRQRTKSHSALPSSSEANRLTTAALANAQTDAGSQQTSETHCLNPACSRVLVAEAATGSKSGLAHPALPGRLEPLSVQPKRGSLEKQTPTAMNSGAPQIVAAEDAGLRAHRRNRDAQEDTAMASICGGRLGPCQVRRANTRSDIRAEARSCVHPEESGVKIAKRKSGEAAPQECSAESGSHVRQRSADQCSCGETNEQRTQLERGRGKSKFRSIDVAFGENGPTAVHESRYGMPARGIEQPTLPGHKATDGRVREPSLSVVSAGSDRSVERSRKDRRRPLWHPERNNCPSPARGNLHFGNAWGGAREDNQEYPYPWLDVSRNRTTTPFGKMLSQVQSTRVSLGDPKLPWADADAQASAPKKKIELASIAALPRLRSMASNVIPPEDSELSGRRPLPMQALPGKGSGLDSSRRAPGPTAMQPPVDILAPLKELLQRRKQAVAW